MADEKQTKHYEALPAQIVTINGKSYGYEYDKLTFMQAMLAEERAQLKLDRVDYVSDSPGTATEALADVEYRLDMASILFVPVKNKHFAIFDPELRADIKKTISESNISVYKVVEAVITDFFTQRGNRAAASKTLLKQGSLKTLLKINEMARMYSNKSLSENGSTNEANLDEGQILG